MHGTEHCNRERRTLCLSASRSPFFAGDRINASKRAATASRPEPETRNGLSLSRNGCRLSRPPFRGQRSRPATSSRRLPIPQPVRLFRSATFTGSPRLRLFLRVVPVAASSTGSAGCSSCLHSPSGLLLPFGSKRSAGPAACRLAFRTRPISLRSPPPVSIASFGCGSTFQARYVSGGLLFLKPLGTFLTMLPNRFSVNDFCWTWCCFPQNICILFL
jgi:hypothetical protein